MKRLGSLALVLLVAAACDNSRSKLDNMKMPPPPKGDTGGTPQPTAEKFKLDRSGTAEERVARLEDYIEKNAEALDFLGKVYAQQKQQQQAQERDEPAEDAVFAVDIAADLKAGRVEGPMGAAITIVEAWDFA